MTDQGHQDHSPNPDPEINTILDSELDMDYIFSKHPSEVSDEELNLIIRKLRANRKLWLREEAAKTSRKRVEKKDESEHKQLSIDDLLGAK